MTCFLVNLAVTLAQMGQNVGLLDADVFGKSTDYYIGNRVSGSVDYPLPSSYEFVREVLPNEVSILSVQSIPFVWAFCSDSQNSLSPKFQTSNC